MGAGYRCQSFCAQLRSSDPCPRSPGDRDHVHPPRSLGCLLRIGTHLCTHLDCYSAPTESAHPPNRRCLSSSARTPHRLSNKILRRASNPKRPSPVPALISLPLYFQWDACFDWSGSFFLTHLSPWQIVSDLRCNSHSHLSQERIQSWSTFLQLN